MTKYTPEELRLKVDKHREEAYITCQENCWCWAIEAYADLLEMTEANRGQPGINWENANMPETVSGIQGFVDHNIGYVSRGEWGKGVVKILFNIAQEYIKLRKRWEEGTPGYLCNGGDKENPKANRHCHKVRIVRELSGISGELTDHVPDVGKEEE